ncbi:MAG: type II secretion system protein GspJ [Planctomycetota bacterium]
MESGPTQAVLPLVGLAAEKAIRDRYNLNLEAITKPFSFRPRSRMMIQSMMARPHRSLAAGPRGVNDAIRLTGHVFRVWDTGQFPVCDGRSKPRKTSLTRPRSTVVRPWRGTRVPRPGFTLLEVLIVGILTSTLMVGVWSLFHTWGRLYERGEQRVRKAQLERSLCDQFTDDVGSVAYVLPPPRDGKRSNSESSRQQSRGGNRALVGGADWMVLDLLQPPSPFARSNGEENSQGADSNNKALHAPELQRVMYTFRSGESEGSGSLSSRVEDMAEADDSVVVGESEEATEEPFSGLVRIVIPVERHRELATGQSATGVAGRSSGLQEAAWTVRDLAGGSSQERATNPVLGDSGTSGTQYMSKPAAGVLGQDDVPEVISCEFRYYDGSTWTNGWDSRAKGQLPRAVEMRFQLKNETRDEQLTSSDGETEQLETEPSAAGEEEDSLAESDTGSSEDSSGGSQADVPYYRCVVCLRRGSESQAEFNGE